MNSKKTAWLIFACILPLMFMCSCSAIGQKTASLTMVYFSTAVISLLLLAGFFIFIKKREKWLIVLFASVFVVNSGYFALSVSETINQALWANRLSYLGSVFLPFSTTMTIIKLADLRYKKWLPVFLAGISVIVFLIAASPGYLDIYYKSATLEKINGVSFLEKEYGSWHIIYLFYLLGYFMVMSATCIQAISKKKIDSPAHATILVVAVFANICVWLLEQLVKIDFEILSVSYIITELFLLSLHLMIQQHETLIEALRSMNTSTTSHPSKTIDKESPEFKEHCNFVKEQLAYLTATERAIYNCYLSGMSTKEVLQEMSIAENTLKFHNKNIYSKLGVSSRKQLLEYAREIEIQSVKN